MFKERKDRKDRKGPRFKRADSGFISRRKVCKLCQEKIDYIDYKDIKKLERFMTDRGKIASCRISGNCARHQRRVAEAIKRARFVSLLPYIKV